MALVYVNHTGKLIEIGVVTTFGTNIYADGWWALSDRQVIRIGDRRPSDQDDYWVIVRFPRDGDAFLNWGRAEPCHEVEFRAVSAWFKSSGFPGGFLEDNKNVADQMFDNDFSSFRDRYAPVAAGGIVCPALRLRIKANADGILGFPSLEIFPDGTSKVIWPHRGNL